MNAAPPPNQAARTILTSCHAMRIAFDTDSLAHAEGVGDGRRCMLAVQLAEQLANVHGKSSG